MNRVVVVMDEEEKIFDDVTKVECSMELDIFTNVIKIYQGRKVTKFKQCQILGFTVSEKKKAGGKKK